MEGRINEMSGERMTPIGKERQKFGKIRAAGWGGGGGGALEGILLISP